jgi:SagB-type dehydrogenase family enzyme
MSNDSVVRAYHRRSKHHLDRYAAGPQGLDWDSQPDPFRRFAGCEQVALPLSGETLPAEYGELYRPGAIAPRPLTLENLAALCELSLGLAAWKQHGDSRWALRCNPSSGNLHPTEGYVVWPGGAGLSAGVYHYLSHDHALERRCALDGEAFAGGFLFGLSSIHWREAWKYGERAFRYCQLDTGHALAALRYAAGVLGWRIRLLETWADQQVAEILGLARVADFGQAESEDAEAMLWIGADNSAPPDPETLAARLRAAAWQGRANPLTSLPKLEWPVIGEAALASRQPASAPCSWPPPALPALLPLAAKHNAAALIRQRRSGQAYDGVSGLSQQAFYRMLDALLPRQAVPPWDLWPFAPRVHPLLFVHRVEGLPRGLYALPRRAEALDILRQSMRGEFAWNKPADCPAHLPLYCLARADSRHAAKVLSCHQAIAADGAFSLGMLAEFDAALAMGPWHYRKLFWEAGMLGQVLYLEAEAAGARGTGIGCFFDDAFHDLLGLADSRLQSLYHFTVGSALEDRRLQTLPAYGHLPR